MPSAVIEQLRQQFYSSMGINDWTPISDEQAPALIDQWEQYLYSAAQQTSGSGYRPGMPGPITYVPPNQRGPYSTPIYSPGGGVYVQPPAPGSIVGHPGTIGPGTPVRIGPATIVAGRGAVVAPPYRSVR